MAATPATASRSATSVHGSARLHGSVAVPTRSVEQLTELIGRVPLKDLVREATDAIERLCIEAALDLTGDNRASAAEMLGLSRQSLYVKLRRYGLGDLGGDDAGEG
jgi:DNA-binding NtrC family response regulator